MTIQELQQHVDEWIKKYGVRYFDELTNMGILMEEVGELSRHIVRQYGEQSYKSSKLPTDPKSAIGEELGDVLFVLICLANQMDIDITEVMELNLRKKTDRDHQRHLTNDKL